MTDARREMLAKIKSNIEIHGQHIYLIAGGPFPRYAYTIGLSNAIGGELIFAGGAIYSDSQVKDILNFVSREIRARGSSSLPEVAVPQLGLFRLQDVDSSWVKMMLHGALDYLGKGEVAATQVVPDAGHWTREIPDLCTQWSPDRHLCWRWLGRNGDHPAQATSMVATNIDALRGNLVTEVFRWEEDYWELFAGPGPEVLKDNVRVVPLAVLLGIDETLTRVLELKVGEGVWRDSSDGSWNVWRMSGTN